MISLSQRPLPTQQRKETNIHALSGFRTRDPSNQAAADLRLRPHGHWDRRYTHSHTCARVCIYLLTTYLPTCVFIYLSVYLSMYISACLSVCLSLSVSVCLYLYIYMSVSVHLFIYLFVCRSVCISLLFFIGLRTCPRHVLSSRHFRCITSLR